MTDPAKTPPSRKLPRAVAAALALTIASGAGAAVTVAAAPHKHTDGSSWAAGAPKMGRHL